MKTELILQHGWGFDETIWTAWLQQLNEIPDFDGVVQIADRGYFGNRQDLVGFCPGRSLKVVVAHSLGLHFLPEKVLTKTDLLVIISGFSAFHMGAPLSLRRSRKVVAHMKDKLVSRPAEVLSDFFASCYKPLSDSNCLLTGADPSTIDKERLLGDLEVLDSSVLDLTTIKSIPSVLILSGSQDAVVSPAASRALHQALPASQLTVVCDAGHALPVSHANLCVFALRKALGRWKHLASSSFDQLLAPVRTLSTSNLETCIASN